MSAALRAGVSLGIFVATLLPAILRPRRIHEAYWTSLGAASLLALRLVTLRDVADVLEWAKQPLLFLLALLVLSALLECSGFFEWAAIVAAGQARGDARALYRNVFLLGSAIAVVLSRDTTAVILTPLVLAFVQRLRLPARPYVFASQAPGERARPRGDARSSEMPWPWQLCTAESVCHAAMPPDLIKSARFSDGPARAMDDLGDGG